MGGMASTIPGPVGDFVRTVTGAVEAATGGTDAAAYDSAAARLSTWPAGGRVLGDVLRSLLEDTHPDGLDSDDVTLVVGRCYRAAAAWLPPDRVDVTVLLAVLAHALGVDETGTGDGQSDFAWHAPLLVADLLPFAPATLSGYLEATFAEYAREAGEDLP
jgi:hypothetical protein